MTEDSEQAELARAIDRLLERLEKIGGSGWVPSWLTAVGSREEITEWRSITRAYHGPDRRDRVQQFIRAMRKKHPAMPLSFEEELAEEVRKLEADKDLRRREGITKEMEKEIARREGLTEEDGK